MANRNIRILMQWERLMGIVFKATDTIMRLNVYYNNMWFVYRELENNMWSSCAQQGMVNYCAQTREENTIAR